MKRGSRLLSAAWREARRSAGTQLARLAKRGIVHRSKERARIVDVDSGAPAGKKTCWRDRGFGFRALGAFALYD